MKPGAVIPLTEEMYALAARQPLPPLQAKRQPVNFRYDILDEGFLHAMAEILALGAAKYGDYNWQQSRLTGEKGPINHIYDHLRQYRQEIPHDVFPDLEHQLAAVAVNAMMEYWYVVQSAMEGS